MIIYDDLVLELAESEWNLEESLADIRKLLIGKRLYEPRLSINANVWLMQLVNREITKLFDDALALQKARRTKGENEIQD